MISRDSIGFEYASIIILATSAANYRRMFAYLKVSQLIKMRLDIRNSQIKANTCDVLDIIVILPHNIGGCGDFLSVSERGAAQMQLYMEENSLEVSLSLFGVDHIVSLAIPDSYKTITKYNYEECE